MQDTESAAGVCQPWWVVCLCAQWCGVCREYRSAFDALARDWPQVRFEWVDVEDEEDLMGDVDVETFPTVLIADGGAARFLGTVLPQTQVLGRMLQSLQADPDAPEVVDEAVARREEEMGGVEVRRVRWWGSTRYPVAPGVIKHIKDADIVHIHGVDFILDYLALTKVLHKKPLVLSTHGGFFHTAYAAGLKKVFFNVVTRTSLRATGYVLAEVGGSEYFDPRAGAVDLARARRQAGSTLKPFVYARAFERGTSPMAMLADVPEAVLHHRGEVTTSMVGGAWAIPPK